MSRPNLIRADTLDLQDPDAPSAQDHHNQPTHPAPLGTGPAAPHQDAALRQAQEDRAAEQDYLVDQWGSERSSHEGSELLDEDTDFLTDGAGMHPDEHVMHQSSAIGRSSEDSDMTDADEENADDDMVDKISSSPSIDDGMSHLLPPLPHICNSTSPNPSLDHHYLDGEYPQAFGEDDPTARRRSFDLENFLHGNKMNSASKVPDRRLGLVKDHYPRFHEELEEEGTGLNQPQAKRLPVPEIFEKFKTFQSNLKQANKRPARDNDDDDDEIEVIEPCYVDHGWSEQSLPETEDIDFEFVYALHTFVATVEGQANATKGDTMQLLDDSNSYWWLVRVVKDSSIGYLPAEHIETPTERLARLNKHRNADLSKEHLGDAEVKPKSMLKQALKRRTAKIVQFTTPTYYPAADVDWTDEEDQDPADYDADLQDSRISQVGTDADQSTSQEQATTTSQSAEHAAAAAATAVQNAAPSPTVAVADSSQINDNSERPSDDSLERSDSASRRSRNGNIRNTDSFFKDETAEPKKMSLTPSLLRDADQGDVASRTADPKERVSSPTSDSFETIDRTSPTSEKFKDDKKKKKEKSGMLSGLFKRKEKKIKVDEAAGGTVRTSQSDLESMLASPTASSPNESSATSPKEPSPQTSRRPSASGGKLVKSPPSSMIMSQTPPANTTNFAPGTSNPATGATRAAQASSLAGVAGMVSNNSPRGDFEVGGGQVRGQPLRIQTPGSSAQAPAQAAATAAAIITAKEESQKKDGGILSPLSGLVRDPNEPKKEKLKKAKQRMELDVDSSPELEAPPSINTRHAAHTPPPRVAPSTPRQEPAVKAGGISPLDAAVPTERFPPGLESSKSTHSESPISPSTPTESTSTVNTPKTASEEPKSSPAATSTTPDSKAHIRADSEEVEWDNAALLHYLEHQHAADIRDILLRVYDTNDVKPVSNDHPIMKKLDFEGTQKRIDNLSRELDGLFLDFLARKEGKRKAKEAAANP